MKKDLSCKSSAVEEINHSRMCGKEHSGGGSKEWVYPIKLPVHV